MSVKEAGRPSLAANHARIGELNWDPTYYKYEASNGLYPSRYKLPAKLGKDPMRQVIGDFLNMQVEKDDRMFGGLDAAVRAEVPTKAPRRTQEFLKPFLASITAGEMGAFRAMSLLTEAVRSSELRNAYYLQMLDEQRHSGIQMSLYRWYMRHIWEPTGWNQGHKAVGKNYGALGIFNITEQFITGDPIQAAIMTQVVSETGFSNPVNVMMPDVIQRNGDFAVPTVLHTIQSDEARHINNGYATLLYCMQESENAPLLEQDIQQMYWCAHAYNDINLALLSEYMTKDRTESESYVDKWDHYTIDDYYRAYIVNLAKIGINIPEDMFKHARKRIASGQHHYAAVGLYENWPFAWYRLEALDDNDFEWFESKYPGWYKKFGGFWEAYRTVTHPEEAKEMALGFTWEESGPVCWTCQVGAYHEEDRCHRVIEDHTRFYCSPECKWIDETNPGRFVGTRLFFDYYHGWEYSDVVRELDYLRADGQTLLGQPHTDVEPSKQWTLSQLRSMNRKVDSNNLRWAQKLGLPYKLPTNARATGTSSYGHGNHGEVGSSGGVVTR
jgi:propane monooxygenase large subunit